MTNHSVCLYLIPAAPFSSRDHWRSGVWGRRRSSPYTLGPKVIPYWERVKISPLLPYHHHLPPPSNSHCLCSCKFLSYIQVRTQLLSNKPYSYFPEMQFAEFICSGCGVLDLAKFHFPVTVLVPMWQTHHHTRLLSRPWPSGILIHRSALAFWTSNQMIPLKLRVVFEHVFYLFIFEKNDLLEENKGRRLR